MSALTSLLVRDRIVSVSKIEEALHSQVFNGGDIEVILLEMGVVAEDVLSAYRAALFDLLPATREEVMKARDVQKRVPADMARSLGIVPIFFEGRTLVVAAWEPLYEPRKREVEAQLGFEITVRIVNQARLASALAHHYGFELDPRMRRLSDSLRRRDPGVVPYVRPPTDSMRPFARSSSDSDEAEEDTEGGEPTSVSIPPLPPPPKQESLVDDERPVPVAVKAEAPFERAVAAETEREPEEAAREPEAAPPESELENEPRSDAAELTAVELSEDEGEDVPRGVTPQLGNLLRGPVPLARAMELLQVAAQRDDVLFVLLRYVQQFFDFTCVFSVGKDGVRARMAHGAGLPRDLVEHVFVAAPNAGLMADVIRSRRPQLGYLGSSPEEHPAATLLHRELGRLGLAVPIELNQRVVLMVYADRVGSGLSLEQAEQVKALIPAVCTALRRIILDAKNQRSGASESVPPPAPPPPAKRSKGEVRTPAARAALAKLAEAHVQQTRAVEPPAEVAEEPPTLDAPAHEDAPDVLSELAAESERPAPVAAAQDEDEDELPSLAEVTRTSDQDVEGELSAARAAYDAETEAALSDFEQAAASDATPSGESELSAVDLDAFERMMREDANSDLHVIAPSLRDPNDSAQIRERIAGVPRSAPPPPRYEPAQPPPINNGYRHRGSSAAAAQERLRVELASAAKLPLPDSALGPTQERRVQEPQAERGRLSLVEPAVNEPTVIIDMGESVDALVEALMQAPANTEPRELDELLTIGESALPVLMQHFPGPLWIDRKRAQRRRPRGRDVSAVARAVVAFGDRAAPYVASLLAGGDPDRSFFALLVAGEIVHADLLDPVARRVLDRDETLRALALDVLRSYSVLPQYDTVVRAISDLTERPGKDPRRQRLAVEALGALRDTRTLRTLLTRLSDRDEQVVQAAHDALVTLTGQDFGFAARKWESWVEGWGRAHRVEWLIESLLHSDENVRTTAGEELKQLTQQYFGYHPSLSKRDRELAQRKYREWWEMEGRLNFR